MRLCFGWLSEYKSKVCSDQNSGQSVWSVLNQVEAGLLVCVLTKPSSLCELGNCSEYGLVGY